MPLVLKNLSPMKISAFTVCDSNDLEDRASIGSGTTDKRVWSFSRISQQIEILAISRVVPCGQIILKQLSFALVN